MNGKIKRASENFDLAKVVSRAVYGLYLVLFFAKWYYQLKLGDTLLQTSLI